MDSTIKSYKDIRWLRKRKQMLKRDNNECQRCKHKGKFHKAECVHHIKHLKKYPNLALVDSNLISLCFICHNEEHPEKLHSKHKKQFINKERWE